MGRNKKLDKLLFIELPPSVGGIFYYFQVDFKVNKTEKNLQIVTSVQIKQYIRSMRKRSEYLKLEKSLKTLLHYNS